MAEVIDWSPVDDDNNSAPPVGAPEGMMPSAVNNTMRAMMGSLRRNHDTIVAGTQALPYVPTAGGVITGNLAVNGIGGVALSSTQLRNISSGLEVYNAGGGSITSRGPGASFVFGNRDQVSSSWYFYAAGGAAYLANDTGIVLSMSNAGDLAISGSINTIKYEIANIMFAERISDAHVIYDGGGEVALALYGPASGNINYYQAGSHVFQSNAGAVLATIDTSGSLDVVNNLDVGGTITVVNVTAAGNISAVGTITGQQLTSSGNISAAGTISTVALTAGGTITGAVINSNGSLGVATDATITNNCNVGNTVSAAAFVDTTTMLSLVDMIAELRGRIEALEAA